MWFLLVALGVFGAIIGSFLNVVIWRVPRGESIASPPSACPSCSARIRWFDNVPVLSWLLLRGRCRDCAHRISVRYPLVEAGTALAWVAVGWWFLRDFRLDSTAAAIADTAELLAFLWLASAGIALALIDLDVHRLPNPIVLATAIVVGALLLAAGIISGIAEGSWDRLALAGIGAAVVGILYFVLAVAIPGGMGFGDVKLAPILAAALGWLGLAELLVGSFAPFLLAGLAVIPQLVRRRVGRRSRIPFGPWMIAGFWVGVFAGAPIAAGYLGIFGLGK